MATLLARKDAEYAFFKASDSFGIPSDAFELLRKRYSAEWSQELRELRVRLIVAGNVTDHLEGLGHRVHRVWEDIPTDPLTGPPECKHCGHPYKADTDPAGRRCVECDDDLVLVSPPAA